jgi:hypothetical protein
LLVQELHEGDNFWEVLPALCLVGCLKFLDGR